MVGGFGARSSTMRFAPIILSLAASSPSLAQCLPGAATRIDENNGGFGGDLDQGDVSVFLYSLWTWAMAVVRAGRTSKASPMMP